MAEEAVIIGNCPFCEDGVILDKEKLYVCSNLKNVKMPDGSWKTKGCKFRVFKNKFSGLGHFSITPNEMASILMNGSLLVNLISKNGAPYKGLIRVDKKEGGVKMMFRNKFKE